MFSDANDVKEKIFFSSKSSVKFHKTQNREKVNYCQKKGKR